MPRDMSVKPSAKIVPLRLVEIGDDRRVRARTVLKDAKRQKLDEVLVIGRDDSGELWAASSLNAGQSLWLLEKLRERLLEGNPWAFV
jgi:hypothetical protein